MSKRVDSNEFDGKSFVATLLGFLLVFSMHGLAHADDDEVLDDDSSSSSSQSNDSAKPAKEERRSSAKKKAADSGNDDSALAQMPPFVKVLRVKNHIAVVQFSSKRTPLEQGQKWHMVERLPNQGKDEVGNELAGGISRKKFIGLAASLSSLTTAIGGGGASATSNYFSANLLYGRNKEKFEYGLLVSYTFDRETTVDARTTEIGGQFDYNFSPNNGDNTGLMGLRFVLAVGEQDSSTQSASAFSYRLEPGLFYKWFGFSSNLAAVGLLDYRWQNVALSGGASTTTGFVGSLGILAYY